MASRSLVALTWQLMVVFAIVAVPAPYAEAEKAPVQRRFNFEIDPKTPLAELLPTAPKSPLSAPAILNDDVSKVPEVMIGAPLSKEDKDMEKTTAHVVAKINHLNRKTPDGFLYALRADRADLRGMPFLLGGDCRTEEKHAQLLTELVQLIHNVRGGIPVRGASEPMPPAADRFWREFPDWLKNDKLKTPESYRFKATRPELERAQVVALMQILGPASEDYRLGMTKHLTSLEHADATAALAKLALFAPEEAVRTAAINGLKSRQEKDYVNLLMAGFRYPLAAVPRRAAEALVKTRNQQAVNDLVQVLERPDPRAPVKAKIDGKDETVLHELVRVNHHRNCLLCHAPGNTRGLPLDVMAVAVPLPDEDLPSPSEGGYRFRSSPDIFVRIDMTYLRQDFSMMMKVENAKPWPEMQRFDFFVRTRVLTAAESSACEKQLKEQKTQPYHAAAQYALRELTGQTPADTTPQSWRKLLKQ